MAPGPCSGSSTPPPSIRRPLRSSGRAPSASAGRWAWCGLRLHLADPEAPRPEPDFTQPGYAAFVRATGAAWAAADAAAGTDPEEAKAAAERCIAAYTALPPDEGENEG